MIEAQIRGRFSAGHRILGHQGKCRFPHGHSYQVEVVVRADTLGDSDWIEDFGRMKAVLHDVVEEHFDHAFILDSRDVALIGALSRVEPSKIYVLHDRAPTAERIAEELFSLLAPSIPSLVMVRIWETEQQYASFAAGS